MKTLQRKGFREKNLISAQNRTVLVQNIGEGVGKFLKKIKKERDILVRMM